MPRRKARSSTRYVFGVLSQGNPRSTRSTTAGSTSDGSTDGPLDPSSGTTAGDDDDDDDDDDIPVDAPPSICQLTLNGQSDQLIVNSSKKVSLTLCVEDDVALDHVELRHNGAPWRSFEFTENEQKTRSAN